MRRLISKITWKQLRGDLEQAKFPLVESAAETPMKTLFTQQTQLQKNGIH